MEKSTRRPILGILSILLLVFLYRVFAVYTVRSGECDAKPVDPNLRVATRTENGQAVTYPVRVNFPPQQRPLVVMTYNIAGHDELIDGEHIKRIAAAINQIKPDIVGLEEVHRKTWQSRYRDQLAELETLTHMNGYFGPSYTEVGGRFGNAILTRGKLLSEVVHPLPTVGEPRSLTESVIEIDGATINFYVTHLSTWGSLNSRIRGQQLECVAKHVRTSRYPYILVGDFNAGQDAGEVHQFRTMNVAQLCGEDIGPTHPTMNRRIDYIFADYGWEVRAARVINIGPSDHWPAIAELMWERSK
ncbi:MAG TPA: endonuclease/exonuclease/phosphatase family protein [Thermoanaerobaculia bacterium]|jgi:endonuclease/exonuclease/phosphatase family metal-dependent hydrolase|nr:endonuclease/exonuclease/phosphatase family protein [Thermoanaerobaculia bacterium]